MNWISVTDRLPEVWLKGPFGPVQSHEVLIAYRYAESPLPTLGFGFYDFTAQAWELYFGGVDEERPEVTHWMPLPPLPAPEAGNRVEAGAA